ncbi:MULTISPECIES: FxSxx-COOH cyclophane-containing RiPP peptide [unclassified Streptomyces]|uniref:FxSxx-COOH cyclophane-containing RiPP peptide n=1 Tax=unclassified Streptomyces TaxID=2593676 RepID=UPI002E351479|nr:FxSxx-COOH cyclophane-containing RiPP peptide [Streptomyces sp. NBC_00683]
MKSINSAPLVSVLADVSGLSDAELAELPDTVFADMVSRLREEVLTPSSEPVSAFTSALDPAAGERERTRERS